MQKWFSSVLSSFASTKTITKTKPPTTSTTTVVVPGPAPAIPEAKSENDRGHGLHDNENGCGAATAWTWTSLTEDRKPIADFFLPLFIKQGCVERAIASAGGPKISCQYDGVSLSSVEDGVGQGTPPNPPYVPMDWSKEAEGAGATPVVTITSWSVPKQSWVPYS
ncbi:class V chitinase [Apiospora arundinis]